MRLVFPVHSSPPGGAKAADPAPREQQDEQQEEGTPPGQGTNAVDAPDPEAVLSSMNKCAHLQIIRGVLESSLFDSSICMCVCVCMYVCAYGPDTPHRCGEDRMEGTSFCRRHLCPGKFVCVWLWLCVCV